MTWEMLAMYVLGAYLLCDLVVTWLRNDPNKKRGR